MLPALLLLVACGGEPEGQPLGACLTGPDSDTLLPGGHVVGMVVGEGTGDGGACVEGGFGSTPGEEGRFLEFVDGDGETWTLGVLFPDPPALPGVGEGVVVDFSYEPSGWATAPSHVRVSDASDVAILWIGEDGHVEDLEPPWDLSLMAEDRAWSEWDECGTVRGYDVSASRAGAGEVTVPYGEEVEFDGLRMLHGEVRISETNNRCLDWGVSVARMGVAVVE